jgi:hypothetical protein
MKMRCKIMLEMLFISLTASCATDGDAMRAPCGTTGKRSGGRPPSRAVGAALAGARRPRRASARTREDPRKNPARRENSA